MNKVLKLIIDDYHNQKSSAEYQIVLHRYCESERSFINSLNKKQKVEYLKLVSLDGELNMIEQDEFARYLFDKLKSIYS